MKKHIPLILLLFILLFSCGDLKGDFAVKTLFEDTYRKASGTLEIELGKELQWVYQFGKIPVNTRIGIVLLKKEIFWVDVNTSSQTLGGARNIIYGTISQLPPGQYRIVLTDVAKSNAIIDDLSFVIYSDDDRN